MAGSPYRLLVVLGGGRAVAVVLVPVGEVVVHLGVVRHGANTGSEMCKISRYIYLDIRTIF